MEARPYADRDTRTVTSSITVVVEGVEYHARQREDHYEAQHIPAHVILTHLKRGIMNEIERKLFQGL